MADVFQDVFRAVAENVGKFRRDQPGQTFRGWLRTITRNKLMDHFRRFRQQPAAQGGSTANAQLQAIPDVIGYVDALRDDRTPSAKEDAVVFRQALDIVRLEFEDRTWQAFWRTAVEGQSARQAASEFGMTSEAVRQAKSRVLRRLRDVFGDTLD